MKYYKSGEFADIAHITKKTLRYYHEHHILEPSYVNENGNRYYSDDDLVKLQQILLLKNLGFSLDDIKEMTVHSEDNEYLSNSLHMQMKLIEDKVDQLNVVLNTMKDLTIKIENNEDVDWNEMTDLIHLMGMEQSLRNQYRNASNISARINLHNLYSSNKMGWFKWLYGQYDLKPGMKILEIGCGDGALWKDHKPDMDITLSDISDGMVRDAKRNLGDNFNYEVIDCLNIPYEDHTFDRIVANHVLFYCKNIDKAIKEIRRVLKPDGKLYCSTYGKDHMKEINELVTLFDDRIVLSGENLHDRFSKENGEALLNQYFKECKWMQYEDSLMIKDGDALISYIMSCHGNQNEYIVDRYKEFRSFVRKQVENGFFVTKDAGIFICMK